MEDDVCYPARFLVGGDWNMAGLFSIYWEFHHPN